MISRSFGLEILPDDVFGNSATISMRSGHARMIDQHLLDFSTVYLPCRQRGAARQMADEVRRGEADLRLPAPSIKAENVAWPLKGQKVATDKRPLRHLARFILIGLYSGSRPGAIGAASPMPAVGRAFVDLDCGIYFRRKQGSAKTNKRQPPVPIPARLLAHLRRWHRLAPDGKYFVEFNGQPVASVKTAFKTAVRLASLDGAISPHTLRHTAATWLMQRGVDPWQTAGNLGTSLGVLLNAHDPHHPDCCRTLSTRSLRAKRKRNDQAPFLVR